MTPERLKRVELLHAWLTLVHAGEIPPGTPPEDAVGALRELIDEHKGRLVVAVIDKGGEIAFVPPGTWPATNVAIKALCDIWVARWGRGSAPGDTIRNAALVLKRDGAPWDAVVRSFQRYVDVVEDQYASPHNWRKRWSTYDPETPEHDHEGAQILDSYDKQARASRRGGMEQIAGPLKRLEGKR